MQSSCTVAILNIAERTMPFSFSTAEAAAGGAVDLRAIPGIAALQPSGSIGPRSRPPLDAPVFRAPHGVHLVELVAVSHRDVSGESASGGLFGVTSAGEVVDVVLIDEWRGFNTRDMAPEDIAVAMVMSLPAIFVADPGSPVRELAWSIVDLRQECESIPSPTPARMAVKEFFEHRLAESRHSLERIRP